VEAGARYRREAEAKGYGQEETSSIDDERLKEIDGEMWAFVRAREGIVWEGRLSGWFARERELFSRLYGSDCDFENDTIYGLVIRTDERSKEECLGELRKAMGRD
jgi:cytidylate kinase